MKKYYLTKPDITFFSPDAIYCDNGENLQYCNLFNGRLPDDPVFMFSAAHIVKVDFLKEVERGKAVEIPPHEAVLMGLEL